MIELLSRLAPSDLAVVLCVPAMALVVGLIVLTARIIIAIQRYHERRVAASLVLDMLDRGISPQEIEGVLKAMGAEIPAQRTTGDLKRSVRGAAQ